MPFFPVLPEHFIPAAATSSPPFCNSKFIGPSAARRINSAPAIRIGRCTSATSTGSRPPVQCCDASWSTAPSSRGRRRCRRRSAKAGWTDRRCASTFGRWRSGCATRICATMSSWDGRTMGTIASTGECFVTCVVARLLRGYGQWNNLMFGFMYFARQHRHGEFAGVRRFLQCGPSCCRRMGCGTRIGVHTDFCDITVSLRRFVNKNASALTTSWSCFNN